MKKILIFGMALLMAGVLFLTGCTKKAEESLPTAAGVQGWGYRTMPGARPEFTKEQISAMETYGCIYMGKEEKCVYLTFDEGYENGYTDDILDTLKEKNVKAAFFITMPYLKKHTDLVARMVDEGHTVGNHTVNHPSLPSLSDDEKVKEELRGLAMAFSDIFGKEMHYFRPPMGEYSDRTLRITKDMGYTNVFWSFAYADWDRNKSRGKEYAFNKVMAGLHDGAVLLLHAVSKDNAEALPDIIDGIQKQGYTFRTLDEYK